MRNKQKQLHCVGCDTLVIGQSEFDPTMHRALNTDQSHNTAASNSTGPSQPAKEHKGKY